MITTGPNAPATSICTAAPTATGHLDGDLTAELTESLDTCLDVLAKPNPAEDGTPDPRTPGQRRHDALLQMLKLIMHAGLLPHAGGITTTRPRPRLHPPDL